MKRLILFFVILFLLPAVVSAHPHAGGEVGEPTYDLINVFSATFGTVLGIMILIAFTVTALVMPFLIWRIHNQTIQTADEITKLKKLIEEFNIPQPLNEKPATLPSDSRTRENVEALFKKLGQEVPDKEDLSAFPMQAFKRRKVFITAEEELPRQAEKAG